MKLLKAKATLIVTLIASMLLTVTGAWAGDGYHHTGGGTRVKTVVLVDFDVYRVDHYMKELPAKKSKRAVIAQDTDKKIKWKMLRDVDKGKIQDALRDAYKMNGYSNGGNISKFVNAFGDLAEGAKVVISYDSKSKTTSIKVQGGSKASVKGAGFMKATWSIWFGKIDQPKLGDAMISKL